MATGGPGSLATSLSSETRGGKGRREVSLETLCKCLEGRMETHSFPCCGGMFRPDPSWGLRRSLLRASCEPSREAEASRDPGSHDTAHHTLHTQPTRLHVASGMLPPQDSHTVCSLWLEVSALFLASSST